MSRASLAVAGKQDGDTDVPHGDATLSFDVVYEENVDYLWRTARALGVAEDAVEDLLQEAFLIVHRRLHEFEGRSQVRTWVTGILVNLVRNHRRSRARRPEAPELADDQLVDERAPKPDDHADNEVAARALRAFLDALSEEQRVVFVLSEIEELSAPEIATATNTNVNTVYYRLAAARKEYASFVARLRAKETWRSA